MKIKNGLFVVVAQIILIGSLFGMINLSKNVSAENQPVLNGRIFYLKQEDGVNKIKSAHSDGTNQKDIVSSSVDNFYSVRVSPDGTKITYDRLYNGNSNTTDIYIFDLNTKEEFNLTNNNGARIVVAAPRWTPDGNTIAFGSTKANFDKYPTSGNISTNWYEIHTINADGTNEKRLTNNNFYDSFPNPTNSGKIIWQGSYSGNGINMFSMNLDGSSQAPLFDTANNNGITVDTVNDLVYFSSKDSGTYELWKSNIDGSNKTQLTNMNLPQTFGTIIEPTGDGVYIVNTNLFRYDVPTGQIEQVNNDISTGAEKWKSIQPLTIQPSQKPNTPTETDSNGVYNVSVNIVDVYDGLDLSSIQIISGDANVDTSTGIITATSGKDITYKICSLSNSELCGTFTIRSRIQNAGELEVPNTGYRD